MSAGGVPRPAPPPRAPVGSTPTVRGRLDRQPPRPLLVRLYAATLSDMGILGAPARRRGLRFVARSIPPAVAVGTAALVALRAFEGLALGWARIAAMGALAAVLGSAAWRRVARAAAGERATLREQLELGSLFVVAAYAVGQTAGLGSGESPVQPIVYLVMGFVVAFFARGVGFALVLLAVVLEGLLWAGRGARPPELASAAAHAGFLTLFALLYRTVLGGRLDALRRRERASVEWRMRQIDEIARRFRLLAPGAGDGADAAERRRLWTAATVVEVEAAVRGALEVAGVALRSHTCAVFMLSDDDAQLVLRECRTSSDSVVREPMPSGEGALGGAVKRRAPVRLHGDVKAVSYYADGLRPRALLAVPIVEGENVRGVFVADRLEDRPFSDEDEQLLVTLSAEVVRAAAAERLMSTMKRTRDEMERFYAAIERLNRTTKAVEVFDATLEVARAIVPVDFAAITVVEGSDRARSHRVARVLDPEDAHGGAKLEGLVFSGGLVDSAVRLSSTLPAVEVDLSRTQVFDAGTKLKGVATVKVIPLKTGEQVLGTLVVGARRRGAYDEEAVRQLGVIAMQAANSVLRARLFEETERLATTDGLTGLTNHRTFQARLDEHLAQGERYAKKISLLLCDIDHFKSVNDTYGHPVGDQVLKGVARTLAKEARATDVVARYGGEEFAVVMPETDAAGAMVIAERIRERVGKLVFETEQGPLRVTMSLGVATFPVDAQKKAELVERADACLYHAKRHGRNQSVSAASLRAPRRAAG